MDTKICTKCKEEKPITEYYKNKLSKDGYQTWCKSCIKLNAMDSKYKETRKVFNKKYKQTKKYKDWQKEYDKTYRKTPEHIERRKELVRIKRNTNINFKVNQNISRAIRLDLNKKNIPSNKSWKILTGYTLEQLINNIESKFIDGMSWDNYGIFGWHIDHIKPLCTFSYTSINDDIIKEEWALDNLQPLWCTDNWSKGGKYG
jgi:thiol-disulfide isomerase/thioredoxin